MSEEQRAVEVARGLTPLQAQWVSYLRDNGAYRTNEGTLGDTICSALCAHWTPAFIALPVLMKWEIGDKRGWDGSLLYTEKYTLTPFGRLVAAALSDPRP